MFSASCSNVHFLSFIFVNLFNPIGDEGNPNFPRFCLPEYSLLLYDIP